jgi:transcriptional regulator with GAF, ATPase, and Fis domain
LRERLEDIPLFVRFFVDKYGKRMGKRFDATSQTTIEELQRYSWPGNIRELENLIERAVITSPERNLQIEIPASSSRTAAADKTLKALERDHICRMLEETGWVIEGPKGAAKRLGLNPGTLRSRLKRLEIHRPAPVFRRIEPLIVQGQLP